MWAWISTRQRNLWRWNAVSEAWSPAPRATEFIGPGDGSKPDTFIVAAPPPPVQYEFYFDRSAVEWEEVGMDVTAIGTAGIMRWGKASRALNTAAEALNIGVSDTQLALHVTTGEWVAAGVDVAGLYPPFAIPAGIVGLAMDLWPGVKVRAR